jgi:Telomere resolvase
MALTGRRPAEIFFSASFSLPREKLPYPAVIFDGQLKTRQAPGTSFEPYLIPVLADPKKIIQALDTLRDLKNFPSPAAVNTTTVPQLPKYVSAAFGSLDLPWKPGHLRSAYGVICCHRFKPKNQTDDIFLAQILGHKLLGPNSTFPSPTVDDKVTSFGGSRNPAAGPCFKRTCTSGESPSPENAVSRLNVSGADRHLFTLHQKAAEQLHSTPYLTVARLAWCSHPVLLKRERLSSRASL